TPKVKDTPRIVREPVQETAQNETFDEQGSDEQAEELTLRTSPETEVFVEETGAGEFADEVAIDEIVLTDDQRDRFIDQFIHEYFTALGLAYLSPYDGEWDGEGGFGDPAPGNLAEAEAEPPID
ncbi:MAG: hypothetical protein SYC29_00545, partial [Planctomycetota bacterium]|nr:hypothetical protein [Planctomycetota bacterium]